jgi:4-amino-4-deoxy-L-arabinose transferase-like glycosyltransferase
MHNIYSFISRHFVRSLLTLSITVYILTIFIMKQDTSLNFQWHVFALYSISLALIVIAYIVTSKQVIRSYWKKLKGIEAFIIFLLVSIALFVNFWGLQSYPFVSLGDEVRDAGLGAMYISDGTIKNIFDYQYYYGGFGNIAPTIASFFYEIFGNSVLTYRVPSALIASFNVLLIYLLLRQLTSKFAAFAGALSLLAFPLHLYFGRTELVVIFNCFWTVSILLATYNFFEKRRLIDVVLLGMILGIASEFHTAVRVVAILGLISALLFIFVTNFAKYDKRRQSLKNVGKYSIVLISFFFVGFGPLIANTNQSNFFQIHRFSYKSTLENKSLPSQEMLNNVHENYKKSLMVWFYEPTNEFYADQKPLLPPLLALLWLLGVGYTIFIIKKPFLYFPIMLIFAIPFFNSAITDVLNGDHRLSVLLPVASIFIAFGLLYLQRAIRNYYGKIFLYLSVASYLVFNIFSYYAQQPANKNTTINEYVGMHTIYFLKQLFPHENEVKQKPVCLVLSPKNYTNAKLLHHKQQFYYFLPHLRPQHMQNTTLSDNEVYLYPGRCEAEKITIKKKVTIICDSEHRYACPVNYTGTVSLYYGEP